MTIDLIPVPQRARGAAPTLADLRAIGERAFGLGADLDEHLHRSPHLLAEVDQLRAASADSQARLRTGYETLPASAGLHLRELARPSSVVATVSAAVWIAMMRAVEARCPHVNWPPRADGRRMLVALSTRTAICTRRACVAAAKRRWHDDGRCELCERPTSSFRPHVCTVGSCFVTLELCGDCSRLFAGEAPTP